MSTWREVTSRRYARAFVLKSARCIATVTRYDEGTGPSSWLLVYQPGTGSSSLRLSQLTGQVWLVARSLEEAQQEATACLVLLGAEFLPV